MFRYVAVVLTMVFSPSVATAQIEYEVTDLGVAFDRSFSYGVAINSDNQVLVRSSNTLSQNPTTSLWVEGNLLTPTGLGNDWAHPRDMNDHGHIVGGYSPTDSSFDQQAFLYKDGQVTLLDSLDYDFGPFSIAYLVNADGSSAYGISDSNAGRRAVRWDSEGAIEELPMLSGYTTSQVNGINGRGHVLGRMSGGGQPHTGVIWQDGFIQTITGQTGEALGGFDLNDAGKVIGGRAGDDGIDGFIWHNGHATNLGHLDTGSHNLQPQSINNLDQVVGYLSVPRDGGGSTHAGFVWEDGELANLNDLLVDTGWNISQALDINDDGYIVGYGQYEGGPTRAILMTPVPEPGTLAVLAASTVMLMGRRRRPCLAT